MKKLLLFLFLVVFAGCQSKGPDNPHHFYGTAMTMNYHIIIGSPLTKKESEKIKKAIDDTFSYIGETFNRYNPGSELSKINRGPKEELLQISSRMQDLLKQAEEVFMASQGRFDPTVLPLQLLWMEYLKEGKIPSKERIDHISQAVGWEKIELKAGHIKKGHDLLQLDLGGIAKGYAIDLLIDRLISFGYDNLFVEWGGEIRALGNHPEGRPWMVMISPPNDLDPEHAFEILPLVNEAVATSGDYLQYWETDEGRYCHILNPKTRAPLKRGADSIISVTVKAPTCALADALATAAMLFETKEEAKIWAESIKEENPELSFWFLSLD